MFVSKESIPITVDDINFIFIKPKLNYGEIKRVQRALLHIKSTGTEGDVVTEYDPTTYQQQLLIESVVSWHGPAFEGRPCNAASIAELDPADPLLDKVITEISERNKQGKRESPKALVLDGEARSVEAPSPSANGTSTSASP